MVKRSEAEKEAAQLFGMDKREYILMTKFTPVPFAEEILKQHKIIYDADKNLWRYDSEQGIWTPNAEQFLRSYIRKDLLGDEQQKKNYVEEIIAHLKDTTYNEHFKPNQNPNLIAFENKVFDLEKETYVDFSPDYFITNKINIKINGNSECPTIDKFFADCVGDEYKDILYDLFAYCLYREQPYQKLFFIYGPAKTGKSIYLNLLERFLGVQNYCSIEPQKIQTDPYSGAQMWLKSANIVSDINYDALENTNQVKKMTGGDTLTVRDIYKSPFKAKLYAKQIFSTNKLPVVREKTRAWYRRVYLIEFSNIISNEKEDIDLLDKMVHELPGLVQRVIKHLIAMKKDKFRFSYDIDVDSMSTIYEELSNPILLFIRENCTESLGNAEYWVYDYEFKERLNNWLRTQHFPKMTKSQINEYMKEYYSDSNRPAPLGGKTYRVWVGLKWGNTDPSLNHFNHFNQVQKKVYVYRRCFPDPVKTVKTVKEVST